MKSGLISIQPYYVFLIIARVMGWDIQQKKTVEVRKNFPKDRAWNKRAHIYCSKNKKSFNRIPTRYQQFIEKFLGKVIGEFVCDRIEEYNCEFWGSDDYMSPLHANQNSFNCELVFDEGVEEVSWEYLKPTGEKITRYNAWEDLIAPYLKYYAFFMLSKIEISERKVVFRIGCSLNGSAENVKLWELGIYDYGKWVASVNETQGFVLNTATHEIVPGIRWVITSQNKFIHCDDSSVTDKEKLTQERDCFPIKRKVILKETENAEKVTEFLNEVNTEALKTLADSMFKENLEISNDEFLQRLAIRRDGNVLDSGDREEQKVKDMFATKFCIYVKRGDKKPYKNLPCGELHYNENGLKKVQIGYRFTGLQFLI